MLESCLVTGANGFIGRALCSRLEQLGVRTHRLVRSQSVPGDLVVDLGRDPVPSLKLMKPDVIFHAAGRAHIDRGVGNETEQSLVTVEGTRSLLMAATEANVKAFVFFSSCAVMPEGSRTALDEDAAPDPRTAYGRAKLEAEHLVLAMNGTNGLGTTCLRLPLVYGPGHKGNLPRMIRAINRGIFPPLPELGGRRSMVHVDDVVEAAWLASRSEAAAGKVYLVAEAHAYSSREVYEILLRAMGRRPPRWHIPGQILGAMARTGDAVFKFTGRRLPFDSEAFAKLSESAWFSTDRIRLELGFETRRTFVERARDLVSQPT
jgi:nucleoside-diphosphate-sugar epimerase